MNHKNNIESSDNKKIGKKWHKNSNTLKIKGNVISFYHHSYVWMCGSLHQISIIQMTYNFYPILWTESFNIFLWPNTLLFIVSIDWWTSVNHVFFFPLQANLPQFYSIIHKRRKKYEPKQHNTKQLCFHL